MMRRRTVAAWAACAAVLAGLAGGALAGAAEPSTVTPTEHRRTPDQTFLTFPEWYLVHSPAEYAAYLSRGGAPSAFPLFAHVGQFWQSYAGVNREIAAYPFNGGYHLMVSVIGVSTTVEYGLKGLYERTIGRLAEALRSDEPVPEEQFAARHAQAYVDFIRVEPWYLFDFGASLRGLWSTGWPTAGPNLLRRWERRFALSSELLVKEAYARLIKLGTQSLYDAPRPVTAVLLSAAPQPDPQQHPDYQPLADAPEAGRPVLAAIPRYEAFTAYGSWLAGQGIDFLQVAGNDGEIVVSVLVPAGWSADRVRILFEQPVLTQPGRKRVVFAVPVAQLAAELRRAQASDGQVVVEHVYDF